MTGEARKLACARAVDCVHRRLDGDRLDAAAAAWLDEHLASCNPCRLAAADLETLTRSLRELPEIPLPARALDAVRRRTIGSAPAGGWFDWRAAAAAVLLTALLGGLWYAGRPGPAQVATAEPTQAELAKAAAEARYVLGLTAAALNKSGRVAVGEVLSRRVAPALSKIPFDWPEPSDRERRQGGGDV